MEEPVKDNYGEKHRAECEARWVLKMKLADRRTYLESIEKYRGKDGRKYLEDFIKTEWAKKRPPKGPKGFHPSGET